MEHGRRTNDYGLWDMDDGLWAMDDGRLTMDYGLWTMDDRRWTNALFIHRPSSIVYRQFGPGLNHWTARAVKVEEALLQIVVKFMQNRKDDKTPSSVILDEVKDRYKVIGFGAAAKLILTATKPGGSS